MNAFTLNYQVVGKGPPLLMIHGFGISFSIWESLIHFLSPHFSMIMIELPGIGRSPMPNLEQPYLDHAVVGLERLRSLLNIESWWVFSYSSGTLVTKRYLQMYPTIVTGVVFLCPIQISGWRSLGLQLAFQIDKRFHQFGDWVLSGVSLKFLIRLLGFNLKKNQLSVKWFMEISSQAVDVLKMTLRSLLEQKESRLGILDSLPRCFIWGSEDVLAKPPYRSLSRYDHMIWADHSAPQTAAQQISEVALPFLLTNSKSE